MSCGISRIQVKYKEVSSRIMYVHCYAHCFNLILIDVYAYKKDNRIVFNFFGVMQLTYLIFSE